VQTLAQQQQPALSMTSLEIAELTGKRHDHVLRDTRGMLTELYGEEGVPNFGDTYINPQNGQPYPMFRLPKSLTLTLISGYSVKLRKRIIDRWQELEMKAAIDAFNIPRTMGDALRLAADLTDKALALEHKVAEQTPKVEVYDRIANASGMYTLRNAAKNLQVPERQLIRWLEENGWLYRDTRKKHRAYSERIKKGWLAHKTSVYCSPRSGRDCVSEDVRITSRGVTVLAQQLAGVFPATTH